jgi:hypothetical protein
VFVFGDDGRHAAYFLVERQKEGGVAYYGAVYLFERGPKGWSVAEGNGGPATYSAMRAFARPYLEGKAQTLSLAHVQANCGDSV